VADEDFRQLIGSRFTWRSNNCAGYVKLNGTMICEWWTGKYVRFVSTAMNIQVVFFWIVTSCGDAVRYKSFRGPCCLHLQGQPEDGGSKVLWNLVSYHIINRCHNPEDIDLKLFEIYLNVLKLPRLSLSMEDVRCNPTFDSSCQFRSRRYIYEGVSKSFRTESIVN
jgi:hypothetical protein